VLRVKHNNVIPKGEILDTTKIIVSGNSVNVKVIRDTATVKVIEKNDCNVFKEILIAYAYPLTILIILFTLRKYLITLINSFTDFIKRLVEFKYKDVSAKTGKIKSDKSELPENPQNVNDLSPVEPMKDFMSKKILSTLWHYQKQHFKDYSQRWTFTLSIHYPDYEKFVYSIKNLVRLGLVAQSKDTQQFFLTDYGIFYCKQNESNLTTEIFTF